MNSNDPLAWVHDCTVLDTLVCSTSIEIMSNIPTHEIRKMVARAFSEMYGAELPEYNQFINPVRDSNLQQLEKHPDSATNKEAITEEKHGAIRVPGVAEMRVVTRIFAQMGMQPVEFYDMTILGEKSLPMIATAFRPTDNSINESAFRMFCSMLHPESIPLGLRNEVMTELENNRKLFPKFSEKLLKLLDASECDGGFSRMDARTFVTEVVASFSMHRDKVVNFEIYSKLRNVSDPLADIVLESPVLNHLTPRALDIRDAVRRLSDFGIPMQTLIQGPPIRSDGVAIQLNQIARIAAGEDVFVATDPKILDAFHRNPDSLDELKKNAPKLTLQANEKVSDYMIRIGEALKTSKIAVIQHKARFGEIESRGVALTIEGETAYNAYGIESEPDPTNKRVRINNFKREYPNTHEELHQKGWAYYTYKVTNTGRAGISGRTLIQLSIHELIERGYVALIPQTYNDFLPFSAAAIFAANLTTGTEGIGVVSASSASKNKDALEVAMGKLIVSRHDLHRRETAESLLKIYSELGSC